MSEDIRLYCGIGEKDFNHHPIVAGSYACIAPVCGRGGIMKDKDGQPKLDRHGEPVRRKQSENSVFVPDSVKSVLLDSSAFSDTTFHRLSFADALERQFRHAEKYHYLSKIQRLVAYDVLVDEQAGDDGGRVKSRMDPKLAQFAVEQTIKSAEYLASQRDYIYERVGHPVSLVFSAQGSDAEQYLRCAEAILPYLQPGDTFGLGGWCILGQRRLLMPTFVETMQHLLPMLKKYHVGQAHIFGVCFAEALGPLLFLCDHTQQPNGSWQLDEKRRVQLSTDSVGPTKRVTLTLVDKPGFSSWGYASWYETRPVPHVLESCKVKDSDGRKTPTCSPDTYCRGLQRVKHIQATIDWLAHFREREPHLYAPPTVAEYQQMSLFDMEAAS